VKQWLWSPFVLAMAFGQTSDVPYSSDNGPGGLGFSNERILRAYPRSFSSIRDVDFRNFTFLSFDKTGKPSVEYNLTDGHFQQTEIDHYEEADLKSIHYLPGSSSAASDSSLV
jgi:hypothetical protein